MPPDPQALFDRIQALPPERIAEVEDFVDFIASRASATNACPLAKVWGNREDDVYNALQV